LITINRTKRSIGIDGRPSPRAQTDHVSQIGANSVASSSSTSNAARSVGNSRTSIGNPTSNRHSA